MTDKELRERINYDVDSLLYSASWKLSMVFGAIKAGQKWHRCFVTNAEWVSMNNDYNKKLKEINSFPVPRLDIFRTSVKKSECEINSFFVDIRKDPFYLSDVIKGIQHGLKQLCYILEKSTEYFKPQEYFKDMKDYLNLENDSGELGFGYWGWDIERESKIDEKDNSLAEEIISKAGFECLYGDYSLIPDITTDEEQDVDLDLMSESAKNILEYQEFDDIDTVTAKELIKFSQFFMGKKDYQSFKKRISWIDISNSLFPEYHLEIIAQNLQQYYSRVLYKEKFLPDDIKRKLKNSENYWAKFFDDHSAKLDSATLCWIIDLLGYCASRDYWYVDSNFYDEVNAVMRFYNLKSGPYWYCFDPKRRSTVKSEKVKSETSKKWIAGAWSRLEDSYFPPNYVLEYLLKKHLVVKNGILKDILEVALSEKSFNEAEKKIDRIIKKDKKEIEKLWHI